MSNTIGVYDWVVIIMYLLLLLVLTVFLSGSNKKRDDIFLAGRSMKRWPVSLSMYMAVFSTISFLGVIGWLNEENGTIWIGLQNIGIIMAIPFVVWLYPSLFYKLNITTAYEYLEKRYDYSIRALGASFFLGARIMWLSTMLYAGTLLVSIMFNFTPESGMEYGQVWILIGIVSVSIFLGAVGGMRAIIWTDVIQFFILMGSVLFMGFIAISEIGGVNEFFQIAQESGKFKAPTFFSFTDNLSITSGLLLGMVSMLYSGGADQVVLQTYLTSESAKEAKRSLKLSGYAIKPLSLLFPLLGTIIFVYYKVHPEIAANMAKPDDALPVFILNVLPTGIRGLAIAALLSALFTSFNSGMTALSAVVQVDFIQRWKKTQLTDKQSVLMGRLLILSWGIIIILFGLLIMKLGGSHNIIQILNIVMYPFSGVLLGIFLLGLLTKRANAKGVLIGTISGFIITLFVPLLKFMVIDMMGVDPESTSSFVTAVIELQDVSTFFYGALAVAMTMIIGYMASLGFKPMDEEKLVGLVRSTIED